MRGDKNPGNTKEELSYAELHPLQDPQGSLKKAIAKLQGSLKMAIAKVQGLLTKVIAKLQGSLKKVIAELQGSLKKVIAELQGSLKKAIAKLQEVNVADRKLMDWEGQFDALNDSRRIVKHHPDALKGYLHEFVRAAVPSIDHLRSFTVKTTLMMFQEMFQHLGKILDKELEEILPMLLKKAGEVSTAGRENFLASQADKALSDMCNCATDTRAILALICSANHKSPNVRGRVASHLDGIMEGGGSGGEVYCG
eukprot:gene17057-23352_t